MLKYMFLAIAQLIGFLGLLTLTHTPRPLVRVPRNLTLFTFRFRRPLMLAGVLSFLSAVVLDLVKGKPLRTTTRLLHAGLFGGTMIAGFMAPSNLLFRSRHKNARFISVKEADLYIRDDEEVLVVEVNGEAHAYPHKWIIQPHVAGDTIGGEDVVVTYCSLSHLGRAFTSHNTGSEFELKVGTQYANNLVLYDRSTNRTFQQISGSFDDGTTLEQIPTRIMSWLSFKRLYRAGSVFYYPPNNLFDFVVRALMLDFSNRQYRDVQPQFPTMRHPDRRISQKEQVYGLQAAGEAKAITLDFLKWRKTPFNTTIGGVPVVVTYSGEHDLADAFFRTIDGKAVEVTKIDIHGNTPDGQLKRFPMASRVLWMVWSSFYPHTTLVTNVPAVQEVV